MLQGSVLFSERENFTVGVVNDGRQQNVAGIAGRKRTD
jgi:hypothetical protein